MTTLPEFEDAPGQASEVSGKHLRSSQVDCRIVVIRAGDPRGVGKLVNHNETLGQLWTKPMDVLE